MAGIFWIAVLILFEIFLIVLGIQLCRGKWLNFFRRYKRLSKEEKEKLKPHTRKTARLVGICCLAYAAALLIMTIFPQTGVFCLILIVIAGLSVIIYSRKKERDFKRDFK